MFNIWRSVLFSSAKKVLSDDKKFERQLCKQFPVSAVVSQTSTKGKIILMVNPADLKEAREKFMKDNSLLERSSKLMEKENLFGLISGVTVLASNFEVFSNLLAAADMSLKDGAGVTMRHVIEKYSLKEIKNNLDKDSIISMNINTEKELLDTQNYFVTKLTARGVKIPASEGNDKNENDKNGKNGNGKNGNGKNGGGSNGNGSGGGSNGYGGEGSTNGSVSPSEFIEGYV